MRIGQAVNGPNSKMITNFEDAMKQKVKFKERVNFLIIYLSNFFHDYFFLILPKERLKMLKDY